MTTLPAAFFDGLLRTFSEAELTFLDGLLRIFSEAKFAFLDGLLMMFSEAKLVRFSEVTGSDFLAFDDRVDRSLRWGNSNSVCFPILMEIKSEI